MKPSDSAFQLALICFLIGSLQESDHFAWAGLIWAIIGMGRIWMEDKK